MKILIVSQYFFPEQFKINEIAYEFVNQGHKVTVLTGLPNYPNGIVEKKYRLHKNRKEVYRGVNIIRSFEIGRRKGAFFLLLNYISFMISASIKTLFLKKDYDIVFCYQLSPVTMILPAYIAKKRSKTKLFVYSCDLWPESIKNIIKNENSLTFKITKRVSTFLYSKADCIGVTSSSFLNYFVSTHRIDDRKIIYIPQHAENVHTNIDTIIDNGIYDFVFLGNIGISQDIECILSAVELIKMETNFVVHFVGEGSFLDKAKELAESKKINDYVIFHGRFPLEEMDYFYKLADVCLLTLKNDSIVGQTVPSKLQGYMSAGKPVLGAIDGPAKEIIMDSDCGVCVPSGDFIGLAKEMKKFACGDYENRNFGKNGNEYYLKNFTLKIYMEKIVSIFDTLLEEK